MTAPAVAPAAPTTSGASGEARTFYFERAFGRNAVKVLPGEFFVAGEDIVLSTLLGSCVSACMWDPAMRVGGMNHFMLPGSSGPGESAAGPTALAGRYGAFAMEQLINALIKRGARRENLRAKLFGGGQVMRNFIAINIGERNAEFVIGFLRTEGIRVVSRDLLDVHARRVAFFPCTGRALCRKLAQPDESLIAAERQYTDRLAARGVSGEIELF